MYVFMFACMFARVIEPSCCMCMCACVHVYMCMMKLCTCIEAFTHGTDTQDQTFLTLCQHQVVYFLKKHNKSAQKAQMLVSRKRFGVYTNSKMTEAHLRCDRSFVSTGNDIDSACSNALARALKYA